ncbi:signal recognition particle receptor FtsY [Candidatus Nitrososphaera gargensis Ga9.2]|uniref:Signal recognition particle receptor FtsY n=1 Tax=Nitrososphaera gargensis (strain Ga9.2) TaxID=1237085 RepID=K0IHF3_NITGG|nr:signal recognition particle-docking protein FtsY [Candidatus Nitrososphaera gargensis]AFU59360.1 signal recognition particle receptor FtsY [Candidatus Nitrososphaera gargensis Ga9.2]
MFDKLKKAFSSAAKGIGQKELTEQVLDDALLDLQIALLESDVAQEVVDDLSKKLKNELLGLKLEKNQDATQVVQSKLQAAVAEIFARAGRLDLTEKIKAKKDAKAGPFVIVFLGINGTGKTTTVAKVANLLRKAGFTVVVAAGDTHRAGAIEQLEQHTNRLSLKIVKQRYGADPSSVGRDAYEHAKKNFIDVVLMDTAGRMQTSKNLMDEMGKIVRVVKPDVKLFIGDSLAGNDTINQAREFFQYTNFDGAILTKIDADAKGGAAISIAHITSKPIAYIGVGQGYDDIIPFDPDKFIESLFGSVGEVSVENLMSMPRAPEPAKAPEAPVVEEKEEELPPPKPVEKPRPAIVAPPVQPPVQEKSAPKPVIREEPKPAPKIVEYTLPPPQSEREKEQEEPPLSPKIEEPPKEKKSRFSLFGGKKKTDDDRKKKEEEEKRCREEEERAREEEERARLEEEEEEKKKRKEDKGTGEQEDKVIYLTDEDIEDLLK